MLDLHAYGPEALLALYPGPFGFAAFYDAAQRRMLNGTAPLLRTQQDLVEAQHGAKAPQRAPQRLGRRSLRGSLDIILYNTIYIYIYYMSRYNSYSYYALDYDSTSTICS